MYSGILKKFTGLFLAAALVFSLSACKAETPGAAAQAVTAATQPAAASEAPQSEAAKSDTSPAATGEAASPAAGTAAELSGGTQAAADTFVPKKLYETAQITVELVNLLEDSSCFHVILRAENRTDEEANLEVSAVAFNGVTANSSSGQTIPASGDAYLYLSFGKEELEKAGMTGHPGVFKAGFTVYDSEYEEIDGGVAECVLDGANAEQVKAPAGTCVYEENGVKISSLGIADDMTENENLVLCVENNTEGILRMNGGAAMAPGEELTPCVYASVLPGTIAVITCSLYGPEYSSPVDLQKIPFADILFCIEMDGGERTVITEPVKIGLGTEQRYTVSEDGKTLTVSQEYWEYEDSEWTVTSGSGDVLTVESCESESGVPEEGKQQLTAVLQSGAAGESAVSCSYHPAGISLEKTGDYWPSIYYEREIRFRVGEDGTVGAADVCLEVPNLTGEGDNVSWYYIIDSDGTVAEKNDAAG